MLPHFWGVESAADFLRSLGEGIDHAGHAHNAFLDLRLDTGFFGVAVMAWIIVVMGLRRLRAGAVDATAVNMALLLFLAAVNGFSLSLSVAKPSPRRARRSGSCSSWLGCGSPPCDCRWVRMGTAPHRPAQRRRQGG
jgi:hypothetical protein